MAWKPPPGPMPTNLSSLSFAELLPYIQPSDNAQLGRVSEMAGTAPLSQFDRYSGTQAAETARRKYDLQCPSCKRRLNRYWDELADVLDRLTAVGVSRLSLSALAAIFEEQDKRMR